MAKDINVLLERLNFSEEESKRVISTNTKPSNIQGYEAWVVGKIMSGEKVNREAMYRVLKSYGLLRKKNENPKPDPVALRSMFVCDVTICKGPRTYNYVFNIMPLWIRIYNIPMEQMDRQVAIDVGKAIGEVVAIDWRDRDQGWTDHIRIRVRIDVLKPLRRVVHLVGSKGSKTICTIKYERLPAFCYICGLIGHTTQKCNRKEEHLVTGNISFQYGSWLRVQLGGTTQTRGNWRNGIEILEKKINLSEEIKDARERSGEENDITLLKEKEKAKAGEEESESCSPMEKRPTKLAHDGGGKMRCKRKRVKGSNGENNEESPARLVHWFLGHAYPNLRNRSWDILRTVRRSIREDWVVGGDFNAIISDAEKEGGCRKFRVTMEEFHDVMKELSLVDIKIDKREGHDLPTYGKISSIHQDFKRECPKYGARAETLIHALKDCPTACTIVALGDLDNGLLVGEYSCCIDWIKDVMRVLDMKVVADFITTLWNSWNNHNNFVFRGKEDDTRVI
ncbi:hypothetical protein Godav_021218 [Gossypium davidsonii]|uniref:Zinc knuckle CX2CX4HX4C domain-containing protein n=1 Tax=Gossypium davidsonii TaxID=34287 RepID=A0A7J8R5J1_GOSDV|nr:hypothetical protein [Gossypium davidsonii]